LDSLAAQDIDKLKALYLGAWAPSSLALLEGQPEGRALTWVGWAGRGLPFQLFKGFAASSAFPWEGKTFHAASADRGSGINRVRLGRTLDLFPFETRVGPSAMDGKPCVILDYDLPQNPWPIRLVHDELRQVGSQLFLGPAMLKTKRDPLLLVFFAVDTSAQG
jgi:hypothetical protein